MPDQSLDFSKLKAREAYQWMIHAIVPRPIAFVTTVDEKGVINLAPFSFFNGVASNPPTLLFSITRKADGSKKDTLLNIEKNGEFTVNITGESIAREVNEASEEFPYGVSELEKVGLHPVPAAWVKPARVKECEVAFECRLEKFVEIGDGSRGSSIIVIGRILGMHVSESVITDGKIDYAKLRPLARLGGNQWLRSGEVFELKRPE